MTDIWNLEQLDVDGAIRETAEKVDPVTRASFLKKAGIGLGAVAAGSAFAGAIPRMASGATIPASDVAILNFALTLEYLEAAFYTEAVSKGAVNGKAKKFATVVAGHERAHVAFLKKALGSAAVAKPKFNFKGTTANQGKFLATAKVLEDTGVAAYLGQVGNIKTPAILKAAGSILPIEARHAGWVRDILNVSGAPSAFEGAKTKSQILAAVNGTGFIVG